MAHSEGFEPHLSIRSASFSAHIAIIAVRDSVVNHFDIAVVCTFVGTLVLLMKNRGLLYRGAGELLTSCDGYCIWGDTLEADLKKKAGIRYRLRPVA